MVFIDKTERYEIARAALLVLTWIPTVVIFFCSLCLSRRRKDPARSFALPLKFALLFFAGSLLFNIVGTGAVIATYHVNYYNYSYYSSYSDDDLLLTLYQIRSQFAAVDRFFNIIAEILIFLALVLLSTGIAFARTGEVSSLNKIIKWIAYGASAIILILALSEWAIIIKVYVSYYTDDFFTVDSGLSRDTLDLWNASRQLDFSIVVLFFILSLTMVALSIFTLIQSKAESNLKHSAVLLLTCCILWVLRTTYLLASQIKYTNLANILGDPQYDFYMEVVDVILYIWPAFVILCILFGLSCKKARGLWSTEQPFVAPVAPVAYGNQASYGNNWNQPTSPMQQQQPYYPPQNMSPPPQQSYYAPPEQQQQYQQQYQYQQPQQQPQQHQGYPPAVQSRSPPPHDEAMGFNHQADGTPPQAPVEVYAPKN